MKADKSLRREAVRGHGSEPKHCERVGRPAGGTPKQLAPASTGPWQLACPWATWVVWCGSAISGGKDSALWLGARLLPLPCHCHPSPQPTDSEAAGTWWCGWAAGGKACWAPQHRGAHRWPINHSIDGEMGRELTQPTAGHKR